MENCDEKGKKDCWEKCWKMESDRATRRCCHSSYLNDDNDDDDDIKNNTNIITKADEVLRIINNVDLIVGFHPDQTMVSFLVVFFFLQKNF